LERESESTLRRRRTALRLLTEIKLPRRAWSALRDLVSDQDTTVAVLACKICLDVAASSERKAAALRLRELLPDVDWMLAQEIRIILDQYGRT
jgi:hypothetical protein